MYDITITTNSCNAKTIEDCKKQATERLRKIEEARKVINIVANILRNYTGPKNAALCTKINKNAEILELFPGWPKSFGVSFETAYRGGKDYRYLLMWSRQNNFLDGQRFYLNDNIYNYAFNIDAAHVEKVVNNWLEGLDRDEMRARFLLEEAGAELKNFKDFFEKLESLKNEYKNVLDTFYIHNFPYNGKLSIY